MRKSTFFLIVALLSAPVFGAGIDVAAFLQFEYPKLNANWTELAVQSTTWTGDFDMEVVSSVYYDGDSTYAFIYELAPTTDGVFALNLAGRFDGAGQIRDNSDGFADVLYINFDGDMSVVIVPTVATGEHFVFSFLVDSSGPLSWGTYQGNALGNAGATSGYAFALPEPFTLPLLGIGLLLGGFAGFRRKSQKTLVRLRD